MTFLLSLLANPKARECLLFALLLVVAAIGIPLAKHHYDATQQKVGYDKRAAEDEAAADAQTARNLDLQRAAEKRYTVKREAAEKFITVTTKEVIHEAAPLASCDVPEPVRLHLNAAADCARGDSPGSCGSGDDLPAAR